MKILFLRAQETISYRFSLSLCTRRYIVLMKHRKFHPHQPRRARYVREKITDAWDRNISRQCKFNLTLIRLLSHKCHISLSATPSRSRLDGKITGSARAFSIFPAISGSQPIKDLFLMSLYCMWQIASERAITPAPSSAVASHPDIHLSHNVNAKRHLCRF